MEVNVTVILQALQFACAYYFLYKFLFAPACRILDEQEVEKQILYKNLEQAQQIKDALLQDYHIKNDAFRSILLQSVPEQATQTYDQQSISHSIVSVDTHDELPQEDRQEIQQFLVDRLSKVVTK